MTPMGKLIQEHVRTWQGVSLSDSRAEALASILATLRRTTTEVAGRLDLEATPGAFETLLRSTRLPPR